MKPLFFIFLSSLFCGNLFSQDIDTLMVKKKTPKVGLVLSGGGAKGLAHIGVLKVLEEEGVQVDYIGGTSMGAMIGGLYAVGYTANQLDSIFRVTDFDKIVQDNLTRKVTSFYEKENDEKYALTLPFQKMKFVIPIAFSKGQNTFNLFNQLIYDFRSVTDFSKLPIPFLCVATDAETGEEILLNKGNLARAIVASGAFPSLFSPVLIDGRYLIDGGIVNNYPIERVKEMGADIIIGIDVQTDLMDREQLTSATKMIMQIINFQMLQTMNNKKQATDIYIRPDITNFNVVSFGDGTKIVQNGIMAAEPFREQFRQIALLQEKDKQEKRTIKNELCLKNISSVDVKGTKSYSRAYVMGKLRFKPNEKTSFVEFNEGINRLSATQNFQSIGYHFEKDDEGGDKLVMELKESEI